MRDFNNCSMMQALWSPCQAVLILGIRAFPYKSRRAVYPACADQPDGAWGDERADAHVMLSWLGIFKK
jgi:hypothetical protein